MLTLLFIIIFLLVLGILVLVHEFGHFIFAKMLGVKVEEFALGFKPTLYSSQKGETKYMLNAIPFGGFVKLHGEDGEEMLMQIEGGHRNTTNPKRAFYAQKPWKRGLIAAGGVIMNFILAWLLITIWLMVISFRPSLPAVFITDVIKGSSAATAGIQTGDLIISADSVKISTSDNLQVFTKEHIGQEITLIVRRFGRDHQKTVTLGENKEAPLGVAIEDMSIQETVLWYEAPYMALVIIKNAVVLTLSVLWEIIRTSVMGAPSSAASQVSGPIGVYGLLSQMVSIGFIYVLRFVAVLSLSLGIFNILPFPALDGGRLMFIIIEGLIGKKVVRERVEAAIHSAGFILLLALILMLSLRDVVKIIKG